MSIITQRSCLHTQLTKAKTLISVPLSVLRYNSHGASFLPSYLPSNKFLKRLKKFNSSDFKGLILKSCTRLHSRGQILKQNNRQKFCLFSERKKPFSEQSDRKEFVPDLGIWLIFSAVRMKWNFCFKSPKFLFWILLKIYRLLSQLPFWKERLEVEKNVNFSVWRKHFWRLV